MGFSIRESLERLRSGRRKPARGGVGELQNGPDLRRKPSSKAVRGTMGIPGAGLHYSQRLERPAQAPSNARRRIGFSTLLVIGIICLFAWASFFG